MEESRIHQDASEWEERNIDMTPLLLIGAVLMLGLAASKAQAKAEPIPATEPKPIKTAPKTKITIAKPAPARQAARARVAQKAAKKKTIKRVTAIAKSARARQALANLLKISKSTAVPASVRTAAQNQVNKIIAKPATVSTAEVNKLPTAAKIALASAIVKNETVKPTASQAAQTLSIWTKGGGNQGTKANRSATVKKCQELMGLTADGIIGPNTRKRAKELGYTLAARSAQKPGAVGYESFLQY
jgi:uncharacterized protein (UPF0147 family)